MYTKDEPILEIGTKVRSPYYVPEGGTGEIVGYSHWEEYQGKGVGTHWYDVAFENTRAYLLDTTRFEVI
jgi:hypothetical protein